MYKPSDKIIDRHDSNFYWPIKIKYTIHLVVNKSFHYYYIQTESNDKEETRINIFSVYVVPLLKDINHPALLQ